MQDLLKALWERSFAWSEAAKTLEECGHIEESLYAHRVANANMKAYDELQEAIQWAYQEADQSGPEVTCKELLHSILGPRE